MDKIQTIFILQLNTIAKHNALKKISEIKLLLK